jgi:hypothetical protein
MTESAFETCKHGRQAPRGVLDDLPDSQAGTGRHKCAVCAYEAGIQEGIQRERAAQATVDNRRSPCCESRDES